MRSNLKTGNFDRIKQLLPEVKKLRQRLTKLPEIGFKERKTAAELKSFLRHHGLRPVNVKTAKTGFYVDIVGTKKHQKSKNYLFRADMDATPHFFSSLELNSKGECQHLCGHDGHSAILAGAAVAANFLRDHFAGIRRYIFQPAEELGTGAQAMINGGVLTDIDAAFALHAFPHQKAGMILIKKGCFIPYSQRFKVTIQGIGGHGRTSGERLDTAKAFAEFITHLYKIPCTIKSQLGESALCIYSYASEGEKVNPEYVNIYFCYRLESQRKMDQATQEIKKILTKFQKRNYSTTFDTLNSLEGLITDTKLITKFKRLLDTYDIDSHWVTEPANAAEDFSKYLIDIPGFMFGVTNGSTVPLHNPKFRFNDAIIINSIKCFTVIALEM